MMDERKIRKYVAPTSLDYAPNGITWTEIIEERENEEKVAVYIQTSNDIKKPKWIKINHMLDVICDKYYKNESFIVKLLAIYSYVSNDPLFIKDIIR